MAVTNGARNCTLSFFNCRPIDAGPVLYLQKERTENVLPLYESFPSSDPSILRIEEQVAPAIRRRVGLDESYGTIPIYVAYEQEWYI
jgi:hypothetical protein